MGRLKDSAAFVAVRVGNTSAALADEDGIGDTDVPVCVYVGAGKVDLAPRVGQWAYV